MAEPRSPPLFLEASKRYGFKLLGVAEDCRVRFHAITDERHIQHPAASAITAHAAQRTGKTPA